ncbi:MAG: GNAT family N-acetyltransferase [Planctomycetota bacterium]|nr:GNAT family N-acetyltransferase [Planctomycetota bacterium]
MSKRTTATICPASSLDASLLDRWYQLQRSNPALDSPFFSSSFTQAVAAERHGVEVAVIETEGTIVGFLPYCRQRRIIAAPVAGSLTDFQGLIAQPDASINMRRVLRDGRLSAWQFDHLVTGHDCLSPFQWAYSDSPFMDLSDGFEPYRKGCRQRGGKEMAEVLRKTRKLDREVAHVRFEPESTNCRVLDTLIDWKQQQLRRQRRADCFRPAWIRPLLNRLLHTHGEAFRPMLSAMYVGDELAAINFGLRNGPVLHGWITAFNPKYQKFSPGLMLMVKLAQAAESLGISRIDMGRGDESFKRTFCSGVTRVAEGAVDRRLVAGAMKHSWVWAKKLLRGTPLREPAERLIQRLRYTGGILKHSLDSGS